MSSKKLDGGYVAFLEDATAASLDGSAWELANGDPKSPPTTSTPNSAPTSAPPERSSSTSPIAATKSIEGGQTTSSPTISQTTSPAQSDGHTPSPSAVIPSGSTFTTTSGLPSPTSTSTSPPTASSGNSSYDKGTIAGIITGSIGGLAAVLALFFAPATVQRFVTCGCIPAKRTNKEMRGQFTQTVTETVTKTFRTSLLLVNRPSRGATRI